MILTAILLLNGSLTLLSILSVLALRHSALPAMDILPCAADGTSQSAGVAYSGA
jgi:hypothetical protein